MPKYESRLHFSTAAIVLIAFLAFSSDAKKGDKARMEGDSLKQTVELNASGLTIRIIEIPRLKMVRSGNSDLGEFDRWWSTIHQQDRHSIFPRDFMWNNPKYGKEEWLYAVPAGITDFGGYDTLDFAGGLYAVVTCKESDLWPVSKVVKEWLKKSQMFLIDDQNTDRYNMVHIITPKAVKEKVGFNQMDFFFPIKFR